MIRSVLSLSLLLAMSCSSSPPGSGEAKPAGTPTDPVEVCERLADVCRIDGAKLGVCTAPGPGPAPAACAGHDPCYICASQH